MTFPGRPTNIRGERDRFVAFSFAVADLLLELDRDGVVVYASGAAQGLTGCPVDRLPGQPFIDLVADADRKFIAAALADLSPGNRLGPLWLRLKGTEDQAMLGACKLPGQDDRCHLTLSAATMPAAQTVSLGRHGATGLLQKDDFAALAGEHLQRAEQTGQEVKLTLFRLSGIEELHERLGAEAAEEFLAEVGALLRAKSVGGDSAGHLEGDKYGVVHSAQVGGDTLLNRVGALIQDIDPDAGVDIAGATVDLGEDGHNRKDAAQALVYAINSFAAAEGDNLDIASLARGLKTQMADTMGRIASLKQTFRDGDFRIVFQPIVELKSRDTHHHEVLARFKDGGSPFEIITFAEDVGLVLDFDLAVCQKAIDYLAECREAGTAPPLAVNISSRSLENDGFVAELRRRLDTVANRKAGGILFEITESTEIANLEKAERTIQMLRADGHKVCMDDFGAGAASFPYLRALTLDYVKMDGAYVKQVLTDPRDAAILKAMAGLCRDLSIGTVAEMIETEEQAQALLGLGVDLGQGWLFGKPADTARPGEKAPAAPKRAAKRRGYKEQWG